ncbi:MAG: hypothetical protein Q8O13_03500 [Candidatus Omnitrophota bacterium]|nr:hypothetical protein [Candidatus Omnitrophota bacterium]
MEIDKIKAMLKDYLVTYDKDRAFDLWKKQSQEFRNFWQKKIMNPNTKLSIDNDLIPIVQILDVKGLRRNAKEKETEGVAFTNIFQNNWYKIFNDIKADKNIKSIIDKILSSKNNEDKISLIDKLYEINTKRNSLTGKGAVVINDLLFAYNPEEHPSVVSLVDRYKLLDFFKQVENNFFNLKDISQIRKLSIGEQIINTNKLILSVGKKLNLTGKGSVRCLSKFVYEYKKFKVLWKSRIPSVTVSKNERGKRRDGFTLPGDILGAKIGEWINFRDMDYAPVEENGVIFLFSKITEDTGIKIISIQKHFPDAIGIKYDAEGRGQQIFIEFEYKSSDFERHGHLENMKLGKPCNLIVCWEDDWSNRPKEIGILELKEYIRSLPGEED